MSADLHLHIFEGITEEDLEYFKCDSLGSKYFDLNKYDSKPENLFEKIGHTPNIWIGEVSWLKAGLFEDNEKYIPSTVGTINELIDEDLPLLTNELIDKIVNTFNLQNITTYSIGHKENVRKFLEQHKGKKVFTVSW